MSISTSAFAKAIDLDGIRGQLQQHCFDCHSSVDPAAGLDLTSIGGLESNFDRWVAIHDRIESGEMPPEGGLPPSDRISLSGPLRQALVRVDREQIERHGRTVWRRMNRFEYESTVRDLLAAPWLQLASMLPEDGELYRFNKLGDALDVSHVSMGRYIQAAQYAFRESMAQSITRPTVPVERHYAREQGRFNKRVHFNVFNRSSERATFPLIDYDADLDVLRDPKTPFTVGDSNPELREREAFGVVASSYEPIEIRFDRFEAPRSGRYKLRFKGYTFWAGVTDHKRFRADRENTSIGRRSEPVAIYSRLPPRQLRKIGQFDFQIEPSVQELDVLLLEGESIQPDAVRLFRSRPPAWRNPLASEEGMPGVAFNWMEVEGPIQEQWPPAGHQLLFGNLPLRQQDERVVVDSSKPREDAERLMKRFLARAYSGPVSEDDLGRFLSVVHRAMEDGHSFTDSMLAGYTAVLCSPGFLCMEEPAGPLDELAVANRLGLFLWNAKPDPHMVLAKDQENRIGKEQLQDQVQRMLGDPRSDQFVRAFLDYWLDLRKVNDTAADELLYPDYYLDDSLVDAAVEETQLFFRELVTENLPVRNLVDSNFTFLNERLAKHYGLPAFEGAAMRRVELPADSMRGGLLTQASVLKVTANGTTTSPVVRGAWINERILGKEIPAPPPSVPAIEPDTRGATTVRQQLELHRADESCNTCHRVIDPPGFALESFDVVGGYREHYRSLGEGEKVAGFGKNGQPFTFVKGPKVDASGTLAGGESFSGIVEFKKLLLQDERAIARNLVEKLVIYSTGSPPRFSDRDEIEAILDRHQSDQYPVRDLITSVATSQMFLNK